MKKFVQLINKVFDGDYFDVKSYSIPCNGDELYNNAYCIDIIYMPENTFVQKIKFYYKDEISKSRIKHIENNSKEWLLRNMLFSKETDGSAIDSKHGTPIKMFADYKKQILELNKNKINE